MDTVVPMGEKPLGGELCDSPVWLSRSVHHTQTLFTLSPFPLHSTDSLCC